MEKRYNETYDLEIDRYLAKKMDLSDSTAFEKIMAADTNLQEEVIFRKGLLKAMKWKRQIDIAHTELLKNRAKNPLVIANQSSNHTAITPIRRLGFRRVLAYAASVSLLILAGLSWFANTNYSDRQLADGYTSGLISLDNNLKGGENSSKDPFEQGVYYLAQKEYVQAASFFETISQQNETYVQARLYLAYSQYQARDFTNAIDNANLVITESLDTKDKHKAEWLKLQTQLAQSNLNDSFREQLNSIATNNQHIYQKPAKKLQLDLQKIWRKIVF